MKKGIEVNVVKIEAEKEIILSKPEKKRRASDSLPGRTFGVLVKRGNGRTVRFGGRILC